MKNFILLVFISLLSYSCGKKDGPDQSYIAEDERATVPSLSVPVSSETGAVSLESNDVVELEALQFSEDTCENNNIQRDVLIYKDKISTLGGELLDLADYQDDLTGFHNFLHDSGAPSESIDKFSNAGSKYGMEFCKIKSMIPPKSCWYRTLTFSLLIKKIEDQTGVQTDVTSHYRNPCYNKLVKGVKESDHLSAKAVDLTMYTEKKRYKIEKYICEEMWQENMFADSSSSPLANLSIGLGLTYLHIGLDSTYGRRHWMYNKYVEKNTMEKTCWYLGK